MMDSISEWGVFRLGNLFPIIYKAEAHVKTDLTECEQSDATAIPFISRTENDNGCDCFVENDGNILGIEEGNAIIIGDTTSTIFYQPDPFVAGDHIVVCRADWINRQTALFVKAVLEKDRYRYNYGRAFKMDLIKETRIKLPQTNNEPDWQSISDFMSEIEQRESACGDTLADVIKTTNAATGAVVSTDDWGVFRVDDLFVVKKGKRLTKEDQTDGMTPYVGAIESNNGISNLIGQDAIHEGGTISLSYNGSVGEAFFQPDPFWATDDVNVLYPKPGTRLNKLTGLFICAILRQEQYRYSYGRKWVLESMNDTVIRLPKTRAGNPDWDEMERRIKALPYGDRI